MMVSQIVAYLWGSSEEPPRLAEDVAKQRAAVQSYAKSTGANVVGEFVEQSMESSGLVFEKACHQAARLGAKLVIATIRRDETDEPLSLVFPVLQEGYTLATGGPTLPTIDLVILDPFREISI